MSVATLENPRNVGDLWENGSGPRGAGNTAEGLTHSSDLSREGLPMNGTRDDHSSAKRVDGDATGAIRLSQRTRRDGECLRWTGTHTPAGYGQMSLQGRKVGVHRIAYELAKGPIPPGLEVDHLCGVRDCVNPDHLEAVTHRENLLRSDNDIIRRIGATECIEGHPFSGENLYVFPDGRRACRACARRATQDWKKSTGYALPIMCECGASTTRNNISRHRTSNRHQVAMERLSDDRS